MNQVSFCKFLTFFINCNNNIKIPEYRIMHYYKKKRRERKEKIIKKIICITALILIFIK